MFKNKNINGYNQDQISFNEFTEKLKDLQIKGYEIYIGTDSQVIKDKVVVVSCVCAYLERKGGVFFYVKERVPKSKFKTMRMRLLYEAYKGIETAMDIDEFVTGKLTIHLDIGDDIIKSSSAKYKKELKSYITSLGYACEIKPDSWASSVADRFTKS